MFKVITSEKSFNRFIKTTIIILISFAVISFLSILIFSEDIKLLDIDPTENGWFHFIYIFKVPLSAIGLIIPVYTIWIAMSRLFQYDDMLKNNKAILDLNSQTLQTNKKAFELSEKAFEAAHRPFVMGKSFCYDKKNKQLIYTIINFGKYPARINQKHLKYIELTKNRMSTFNEKLFIVLPDEPKEFKFLLKHDKPKIVESWFINHEETQVEIELKYHGLFDKLYKTKETWKLNIKNDQFEIIKLTWE